MAKINQLVCFSDYFGIDPSELDKRGIFDPLLNVDTPLFIDPLLLGCSDHEEIREDGSQAFIEHFERVLTLLSRHKVVGDSFWNDALRLLTFPEVKGVCLGYGGSSIRGSGAGRKLTAKLMEATVRAVEIGRQDPFLFPVLAVLYAGYGPDRISDMTANITENVLCSFSQSIASELSIETHDYINSKGLKYKLPINPFEKNNTPIFLIPLNILRKIPIAKDWDEVMDIASKNDELRARVNAHVGNIFSAKTKEERKEAYEKIKNTTLTNQKTLNTVMDMVSSVPRLPYNHKRDNDGFLIWRKLKNRIAADVAEQPTEPIRTQEQAFNTVEKIIDKFRYWIEDRRMSTELWDDNKKARHERTAQKIFFMLADQYCSVNGLDISPETDSGGGPVDFKFSLGYACRVLVEIKLSTNTRIKSGYEKQIETYKTTENTTAAFYVVLDVGKMGKKDEVLTTIRNRTSWGNKRPTELVFIDGNPKPSASKL